LAPPEEGVGVKFSFLFEESRDAAGKVKDRTEERLKEEDTQIEVFRAEAKPGRINNRTGQKRVLVFRDFQNSYSEQGRVAWWEGGSEKQNMGRKGNKGRRD